MKERNLFRRLFQRQRSDQTERPQIDDRNPKIPCGTIVYAVGDLHGRLDILHEMEALILDDFEAHGAGLNPTLIYLGDYVDRGFQSKELLDHFIFNRKVPFETVFLQGNHDQWLMRFLDGEDVAQSWLRYGGDATLMSYGVRSNMRQDQQERLRSAHTQMLERFPENHRTFMESLEAGFSFGDYFFCHAGVRPDLPLDEQSENDLLWIREPFLSASNDYGKIIVHGHTVEEVPAIRRNRIGIDTGACYTGNLTCLVLEDSEMRFLSTAAPPEPNQA